MNIVRAYLLMLAGWLLSGVAVTMADTRLPDSSFKNWTGVVRESNLTDGSVLFEYTAKTFSGHIAGASFSIAFIPRFSCAPMISVRLPRTNQAALVDATLGITMSSGEQVFNGIVDNDGEFLVFVVAASVSEIDALRRVTDVENRVSIRRLSESRSVVLDQASVPSRLLENAAGSNSFTFSLLGSRRAVFSAEKHCQSHEPRAYDPR